MLWKRGRVKLDFRLHCSILSNRNMLMPEAKQSFLLKFLFVVSLLALPWRGVAQQAPEIVTNAVGVISLSAERAAANLRGSVTGIATAADAALKGRLFV